MGHRGQWQLAMGRWGDGAWTLISHPRTMPARRKSRAAQIGASLLLLGVAAFQLLTSKGGESNGAFFLRRNLDSNIDGDELINVQQPEEVNKADEIPRLLHIVSVWMSDGPYPSYWYVMTEISRKLAKGQGFDVKVWDLSSLERMINDPNHQLEWVKPAWERVRETGEGARLADFARMLVVYVFGGVFLDLDMIPCSGLEHLVDANGVASFPFIQASSGQVSNAAFSAPPRHPALNKIIHFIADNPNSHIDNVLATTGPRAVATALQQYNEEHDLGLPKLSDINKNLFTWTASGDIRLGTYAYTGARSIVFHEPFYLYHAAFGSWIDDKTRADIFESSCESKEKLHLIEPFIKEQCEGDFRFGFRRCGMEETTS